MNKYDSRYAEWCARKDDRLVYATELVARIERGEINIETAKHLYDACEQWPNVSGRA